MPKVNDIHVEIKVRNNLILSRMEAMGIKSVAELYRKLNLAINQSRLSELISMKESARKPDGEWTDLAIGLADFFQCLPEDIFSDPQQWHKLERNRSHAEIAYAELQNLSARNQELVTPELALQAKELREAISAALNSLSPRQERVLRLRFGFDCTESTLEQIAELFGITRERVRQIEVRAFWNIKRSPNFWKILEAGGKLISTRDYKGEWIKHNRPDSDVLDAL